MFLEKRILKWTWDRPRISDASVQLDPEEISWAVVENRNPNAVHTRIECSTKIEES